MKRQRRRKVTGWQLWKKGSHMAMSTSIIGGADGPTAIFIAGNKPMGSPKDRIRQALYLAKKKRIQKRIVPGTHTLKEVVRYAKRKYGAVEVPQTKIRYRTQKNCVKENLILDHRPELLGSLDEIFPSDFQDEKVMKEFHEKLQERSRIVESIPESELPMDFHMYEIKIKGGKLEMNVDARWDILQISSSGSHKAMRRLNPITKQLYLYYGVSREDIAQETERYQGLVVSLMM